MQNILIIGSGGLRVGQAGEFDYSGSQAIKAFKDDGYRVILANPNIATVQTDDSMADKTYFVPLIPDEIIKIIQAENIQLLALGFGGQTALNLGLKLYDSGVLDKYNIKILGSSVKSIKSTEDRECFRDTLITNQINTPISTLATNLEEALMAAKKIGYPLMLRSGYSLGGLGSGKILSEIDLVSKVSQVLSVTPHVLLEEYLTGWKEFEYEIVRDMAGNALTICSMENLDPMGIHTGESIVVAPVQTLSDKEHQRLRNIALTCAQIFDIIGECNIQFAVNPINGEYRVIEMNPRLSRSSALASKATGYPLAYVAAKLCLGYSLCEIKNNLTGTICAFFEPALDYIVVKIPRWDTHKLQNASRILGTEMKSVGEVMGIGRSFPEALQKAIGMLNVGATCLLDYPGEINDLANEIEFATDRRIFALYRWFELGNSLDKAQQLSQITPWFLEQIETIAIFSHQLQDLTLNKENLLQAKQLGLSDLAIANLHKLNENYIRQLRYQYGVLPVVKQIDTVAGEFVANSNYLYLTYYGDTHDILPSNNHICILGSGPYSIGSSVEFDWCTVNLARELRKLHKQVIIINSNPETVSTDYDESDRLYFEPLSFERVADILDFEQVLGTVVSVGGQIANNLALKLSNNNYFVLGTKPKNIHQAEDRKLFSKLLHEENIDQPQWISTVNMQQLTDFIIKEIGFPVIIRPSYVLSGSAMKVVTDLESLNTYLANAQKISKQNSVVVSKFVENGKEIDVDGLAYNGKLIFSAISEHIENAGVHSGDATLVYPAQTLSKEKQQMLEHISGVIVDKLEVNGPFNMQMIIKDNNIKVIECNVRASRSFPFIAKVSGYNLMHAMALVFLDKPEQILTHKTISNLVGVKTPVFSYNRFKGSDPVAQVEMSSTGEVACISNNMAKSFYNSWQASGQTLEGKHILFSIPDKDISEIVPIINQLTKEKWKIYSYGSTYTSLKPLIQEIIGCKLDALSLIANGQINLVINIPENAYEAYLNQDEFVIRRQAVDYHIPLISNLQVAKILLACLIKK